MPRLTVELVLDVASRKKLNDFLDSIDTVIETTSGIREIEYKWKYDGVD